MDQTQLEAIERLLLRERDKTLRSLGRFQQQSKLNRDSSDADLSSYSFHMADQGTDAMEREKSFLFASKEGRYLYRVEEALRRLYSSGSQFGKCHSCGRSSRSSGWRRCRTRGTAWTASMREEAA
jgi:DnaK suppressor protein